jgi:predicted permease
VLFWIRRAQWEDDLRQEMETHRLLRRDALERAGTGDAATASRRAFGNVTLAREESHDVWIWPWLDSLVRDTRYGLRGLWRQPGFALTSIFTIALGTGVLASVLSVLNAALFLPAPYPNVDRLVQIAQTINGRNRSEASTIDVLALRERSRALSHVTIAWFSTASLTGQGLPERARRVYTDSQAFAMLGVQPLLGRLPTTDDELPDADPVVVIGYTLWAERFGLDRGVIGQTLRVDGKAHTIVAVMPSTFKFPAPYWSAGDLWLLRGPAHASWPASRSRNVLAFGLLREGVGIEQAQAEADGIAVALDARYPDPAGRVGLQITSWAEPVRTGARPRLLLIVSAAGVVFLIVCVNVSNLLISRGLSRRRELAARVALGAGGARLVRQLLTETAWIFLIGGSAGVLAAIWGSRLLVSIRSSDIPRMDEAVIDFRVAATAMAIALAAAAIVGLVPALQATTARMSDLAGSGVRSVTSGRGWRRVQTGLIAAEIALSLVLLSGAGVLLEGARKLARVDPGFDVRGLLQARIALPPDKYKALSAQSTFYDRVIDELLKIPGVTAAGAVNLPPGVGGSGWDTVVLDTDPVPTSPDQLRRADVRVVSQGYLETLGLAPRTGRFFSATDSPAAPVAVVNETFARRYFDHQPVLGRHLRITFNGIKALEPRPREIVGVVADLKEKTLYEVTPPTVYVPIAQNGSALVPLRMALLVRTARSSSDVMPLIRSAISEVDEEQAVHGFMALGDLMQSELSLNRLNLALLSVLSAFALVLAVIGVYGVTTQGVRHRTREIGIRVALGVSRLGVVRLLLREAVILVVAGIGCGALGAIWSANLLRSLAHGINETSIATFVAAAALLAAAVMLASYLPARRAANIDPAVVLRAE